MTDENTNTKTDAAAPAEATNPTPPQETQDTGKTYTESEVNAMMTARLAKQEKALRAQAAEEAKKAAERAQLDEVERVKAEKADIEQRAQAAEARAVAAERKATLAGKVSDLDLALAVAEKHTTEDGTVDVDALLAAHPSLKPVTPGATPITGANPRGQKDPSQMSDEEYFTTRTKQP